jgi:hypothetical protein
MDEDHVLVPSKAPSSDQVDQPGHRLGRVHRIEG